MCMSKPKITKAADPVVPATAPPPEQTAQTPTTADAAATRKDVNQKRKGIAALKIDLNIPGASGSGMSIPQ